MAFASRIRKFFEDLFVGEAHFTLVAHLQHESNRLEQEIARLVMEKEVLQAKIDRYELALLPMTAAGSAVYKNAVPPKRITASLSELPQRKSWAQISAEHMATEFKDIQEDAAKDGKTDKATS